MPSDQTRRSKTGNLVKTDKVRVVDVCIAQIVKVCSEGSGILVLQYPAQGNLCFGGIAYLLPVDLLAALVNLDGVILLVLLYEFVDLSIGDLLPVFHE